MTDFAQARKNMVDCQIHTNGVVDPRLLEQFSFVPRELFVPEKLKDVAYTDEDLNLGKGGFLLSPTIYAKMLQAVTPHADDTVLDIGCGYGYSSAILSSLVSTVISSEKAGRHSVNPVRIWEKLGMYNIVFSESENLANGMASYAPYSLIVINGAVAEVPPVILEQLSCNGRLVTILREGQNSQAVLYQKNERGHVSCVELFDAFSPYIRCFEPKPEFQF